MRKFPAVMMAVSMIFVLTISVVPILAAPYTNAQVNVTAAGATHSVNTGSVYNSGTSASDSIQNTTINGTGYSDGSANVDFGTMGVDVSATSVGSAYTETMGRTTFVDWVTVTSDTLPAGSPVFIQLSQTIDGTYVVGGLNPSGAMFSYLGAGVNRWIQTNENVSSNGVVSIYNSTSNSTTGSSIFAFAVGNRFQLVGDLYVHVLTGTNASIEGQFGSTVNYFLDSQTSGITLLSDSGHNYSSSPVAPEPMSSVLFVTGGIMLVGRRFFKGKKIEQG
jgi:hypothetical protein